MNIDKVEDRKRDVMDARLLERAQDGDQEAFGELWRHYRNRLWSTTMWRVRGSRKLGAFGQLPERAEDIVNEVFCIVWRRIDKIPSCVAFRPWLWGVLRMVIRDQAKLSERSYAFDPVTLETLSIDENLPLKTAENKEAIYVNISCLKATHRDCLTCYYLQGMTYRETGKAIGVSYETARNRVKEAIKRLRCQMERDGLTRGDFYV